MSNTAVEAFKIGANSPVGELNYLLLGLIFSALFLIFAYIILKNHDALVKGKTTIPKFLKLIVRFAIVIVILTYFLLR